MIKLGVCKGIECAKMLADMGYDYIEPELNGIAALSDEDIALAIDIAEDAFGVVASRHQDIGLK